MSWTAIVAAGQRPGVDPLADAFGETWKVLVRIGGEAMLSRVVRTLLGVPAIDRIVVLAQQPAALLERPDTAWLAQAARVSFAESGASISSSIAAVAGGPQAPWPVLLTTADHPLLTQAMVETFLRQAAGADVAAGVVERQTLLASYPTNQRTWLKFRGGAYSGANLFALTSDRACAALDLWASVERDRKKGWKLVSRFGFLLALRALTRTITLEGALRRAGAKLGLNAKPVVLDIAEAAIDVDKPSDHALAEEILKQRS